jgi:metacaspase-1
MTDTAAAGVRRAVIVGVNTYTKRPLDGCVNDATLFAQTLRERFGFESGNVTMLLNTAASRSAVLAQLDELVDVTSAGDTAVVFYAGHGSRAVNDTGAESSGFDSTLMVSDTPRQDILDDELQERLTALGAKTQFTIVIIDACHSGTVARSADVGPKARWYPPVARATLDIPATTPRAPGAASRSTADPFTLIAACRDDEIAQEAAVSGDDPTPHGALTFALVGELQKSAAGATWRDVFERAARVVTTTHRNQHPQIDGNADRELFGPGIFAPSPYVEVTDRAAQTVALAAGALHGVTVGASYTVYAPGDKSANDAQLLGTVTVIVVNGTTSRAKIVSEVSPGAIVGGARARRAEQLSVADALAMDNPDANSQMRSKVTLDILRRTESGKFEVASAEPPATLPIVTSGTRVGFRITNTLSEPVFVNLFDFAPSGSVGALTKGNANRIAAGAVFEIGADDTRKIALRWDGDDATESFKLFATVAEVDLSYLTQLDKPSRDTAEIPSLNANDWCTAVQHVTVTRATPTPT